MPDSSLPEEFAAAVKKETTQQVAKYTISATVVLLVAAMAGWWLYLKPKIVTELGGVPPGAIVAFDRDATAPCPEGWKVWKEATSRVIVGAGNIDETYEEKFKFDENGIPLESKSYRETGGTERESLSPSQMPAHSHTFSGDSIPRGGNAGVGRVVAVGDAADYQSYTPTGTISTEGEGLPDNNMQPYVALYYCKKE